ncbi:hypothetical protein [uncultured Vibrio sp.]|uniref:hypothetical protein n=1 Tax=uncultured Vibrio sp. TaxID=114054 RepID=UPI002606DBB9|nr:hypothetical protein [uncultured Vibrio sp.]
MKNVGNELSHLEKCLIPAISTDELINKAIEAKVINHCKKSGFITVEDIELKSERYKWLVRVLNINLQALCLLDQIVLEVVSNTNSDDYNSEIGDKSAAIIKDLVRRLMMIAPVGTGFTSSDSKVPQSATLLDMK